jgi:hypothetical protein
MTRTVNETLESLSTYDGSAVEVVGLLKWSFENQSLEHSVRAERGDAQTRATRSELWLEVDEKTPALDDDQLERLSGKRVIVTGILKSPDPKFGGCGHFSLWPAAVLIRSIARESR